jgi:Domain of unknown function (DUF4287)
VLLGCDENISLYALGGTTNYDCMPGTFKAYVDNIETKTGKTLDEFWRLVEAKGFVKKGKIAAKHSEIVKWLKSQQKLGHVHSSFIATYIRLRAHDPTCTRNSKEWAKQSGYTF